MKKFRAVLILVILLILSLRAEAKSLPVIGVVDFTSRVTITNLSDEQILTFHTAANVIMDEIITVADLRDLTGETTKAILDEILVMSQAGKVTPEIKAAAEDCEYLLVGYLMNLSRTTDEKIIGKGDGIRASLSVQIYDMSTGKLIKTFTGHGVSKAHYNRIGKIFRAGQMEFSEESLNIALEKAALQISEKIKRNI
ncbi:MAG: hypothetical protein IJT73_11040 [Selenomonadaceae bacterium]|nr:hypothetical protein [Selenomonadaceae bacterium]